MTSPLSPEAVAQMVADREAGTPGPWAAKPFERTAGSHLIGYVIDRPEGWSQIAKVQTSISAMSDWYAPARHVDANARRIARLPDLEAAYLTLAAENATLRAELTQVREAIAVKGGTEHAPTEWAYLKACETIRGRDAELATLRASEAAALVRVAELDTAVQFLMVWVNSDAWCEREFCDWLRKHQYDGETLVIATAALTPSQPPADAVPPLPLPG